MSPRSDSGHRRINIAGRGAAAMDVLSRHLANNYFDVSFGYPRPDDYQDFYKRVLKGGAERDLTESPRVRNILIVGAGASYATFGGNQCPLAKDAIPQLKRLLKVDLLESALAVKPEKGEKVKTDGSEWRRFAEEEKLLGQLHGIRKPSEDFESQLTILSKFYAPWQIREALGVLYGHRYHPHVVFETIAHLLKHRFIDVVVNYNFDELLDQAVQEELRGGDWRFVLSDGDCEQFNRLIVSGQLKVPVYVKPHGTISHKSSLRFTKDAYTGMPTGLMEFTRKLLYGVTSENGEERPDAAVNLITIGFAFGSVELVEMLKEHERLSVFHFDTPGLEKRQAFQQQVGKLHANTQHYFIDIGPGAARSGRRKMPDRWATLQAAVQELFNKVSGCFDNDYAPRHLARHELVHQILFSPNGSPGAPPATAGERPAGAGHRVPAEQDRDYFLARLLVELTLALAKGRGRLDLSGLVGDRVGLYFRLWRDCGGTESLRGLCERLGLTQAHGFAGNVYTVSDVAAGKAKRSPTSAAPVLPPAPPLAETLWNRLRAALCKIDDTHFRAHVDGLSGQSIVAKLGLLVEGQAHELAPRFEAESMLLLNAPDPERVIPTPLGLTTRMESLLRANGWHLALTITERGSILHKFATIAGKGRRVSLIVAQPVEPGPLEEHLKRFADVRIGRPYYLPYWSHNYHMFMVLRREVEEGVFTPLGAVYYRKRGLEQRVSPVYIGPEKGGDKDLELLEMTYFGNVAKAMRYMWRVRSGVPDVDYGLAKWLRTRLYRKWWREMSG